MASRESNHEGNERDESEMSLLPVGYDEHRAPVLTTTQLTQTRRHAAAAQTRLRGTNVRLQRLLADEARILSEIRLARNQAEALLTARDRQATRINMKIRAKDEMEIRRSQEAELIRLQQQKHQIITSSARQQVLLRNRELAMEQRRQRTENDRMIFEHRSTVLDAKERRRVLIQDHEQRCKRSYEGQLEDKLRDIHQSTHLVIQWQQYAAQCMEQETNDATANEIVLRQRVKDLAEERKKAIMGLATLVQHKPQQRLQIEFPSPMSTNRPGLHLPSAEKKKTNILIPRPPADSPRSQSNSSPVEL
eukprot:PhF_6_TR38894/c0_g1_i1/m.58175